MRRMLLFLSVAVVMAAMLVVTAGPALAQGISSKGQCKAEKERIKSGISGFPFDNQGQCIKHIHSF